MGTIHPYRLYTKVSAEEHRMILKLCADYGFRSTYQLMQTLVRTLLRYADSAAYEEEEQSLGKEIEDMFSDMMTEQERTKAYTSDRRRKR
jgi:hypothetical protein